MICIRYYVLDIIYYVLYITYYILDNMGPQKAVDREFLYIVGRAGPALPEQALRRPREQALRRLPHEQVPRPPREHAERQGEQGERQGAQAPPCEG